MKLTLTVEGQLAFLVKLEKLAYCLEIVWVAIAIQLRSVVSQKDANVLQRLISISDAPTCDDGVKDQDETDVDCGGVTCPGCAIDQVCVLDGDCISKRCDAGYCGKSNIVKPANTY